MARNAPRKNSTPAGPAPAAGRRRRPWTALLLLAAAGLLGGAIYLAVSPPGRTPAPPPGAPGPSEAQRTRRAVEDLLASADRLDAGGGPANLVLKRKAYEDACNLARKYIRLSDPRDVVVRPALARGLLRMGRTKEAERVIDTTLRLAPGLGEALWLKGEILKARGDRRALDYFRRAAEDEQAPPTFFARLGSELLLARQYDEAETWLLRAERAGIADRQVLMGLAMLAMRKDRYDRAESLLERLAAKGSPGTSVLLMLAEARKYTDRLPEAERALRQALAVDPSPAVRMQLGDILVLQDRRAEAAEQYAKAAEHPSAEVAASYKAAQCYYLLGKYALAMKYIDRAAAGGENADIAAWRKKIEDARFGAAPAGPTPLPGPASRPAPPPRTGGLLDELLRAAGGSTSRPAGADLPAAP